MSKTMNKLMKVLPALLLAVIVAMIVMIIPAFAAGDDNAADVTTTSASQTVEEEAAAPDNTDAAKALGTAIAIGLGCRRRRDRDGQRRCEVRGRHLPPAGSRGQDPDNPDAGPGLYRNCDHLRAALRYPDHLRPVIRRR